MNYFCIIFLKRERCIADYFQQYLDAVKNNGEFYRRPLAGNPSRHDAQVDDVNKIKRFMKIICKKKKGGSRWKLYQPQWQSYLCRSVVQRLDGWVGHYGENGSSQWKLTHPLSLSGSALFNLPNILIFYKSCGFFS